MAGQANYLAPAPLSRRPSIERTATAVSDGIYGSFRDRADSRLRSTMFRTLTEMQKGATFYVITLGLAVPRSPQ
jgi:hypothetical protein